MLFRSANERIEVHSCVSSNGTDNLFISEIASDGSDAGLAASRRDDLGQALTWVDICVVSSFRGDGFSCVI